MSNDLSLNKNEYGIIETLENNNSDKSVLMVNLNKYNSNQKFPTINCIRNI